MNKNRYFKLLIRVVLILFICITAIYLFTNNTFAMIDVNSMKPSVNPVQPDVLSKAKKVLGAVQAAGSIISVIILAVIGIKIVMGSAEEKAEYKKTMVPYIIGAIILFAASNLVQMVYEIANKIN